MEKEPKCTDHKDTFKDKQRRVRAKPKIKVGR